MKKNGESTSVAKPSTESDQAHNPARTKLCIVDLPGHLPSGTVYCSQ